MVGISQQGHVVPPQVRTPQQWAAPVTVVAAPSWGDQGGVGGVASHVETFMGLRESEAASLNKPDS